MSASAVFDPILSVLPPAQRAVWQRLSDVPHSYCLYGGTAIALQLGHRTSVDFDFFGYQEPLPIDLAAHISLLADASTVRRETDTLIVRVEHELPVLLSFFFTPELGQIEPPLIASDTGIRVASLTDLAGTKADVVQKRAAARDYIDMAALIDAGISLGQALAAARAIQGPSFNPQVTLKALSYFDDGDLASLPAETKKKLQDSILSVDVNALPRIDTLHRPFSHAGSHQ